MALEHRVLEIPIVYKPSFLLLIPHACFVVVLKLPFVDGFSHN